MTQINQVYSADYADALMSARRAKNVLTVVVLFVLVFELTLFFGLRYYKPLTPDPMTLQMQHTRAVVRYFLGLNDYAGLIAPALLAVTLYVILKVQLVGRLLGTGRMTSAFLWAVGLTLLMFPWQGILNNPSISDDPAANGMGMKIPGIVYTWPEISDTKNDTGATFSTADMQHRWAIVVLHWARFVGFPLLGIVVIGVIYTKSQRGLRQSFYAETDDVPATDLPAVV